MIDIIAGLLLVFGAFFSFAAAIGMLRMPDLLIRMHAATKAGTLGLGLILLATVLHFFLLAVTLKALLTLIFVFITAPIGAQMIGRAAYFIDIPLCKETMFDELREYYQQNNNSGNLDSSFKDNK